MSNSSAAKKKLGKKIEGLLDTWSLLQNFNTEHPDFGTVARFLGPEREKWTVKITTKVATK